MSRYVSELGDSDPERESILGDAPQSPTPAAPSKDELLKVAMTDPMVAASVKSAVPAPSAPPKSKQPDKTIGLPTPPHYRPPGPAPTTPTKKSPPRPVQPMRRAPPTDVATPSAGAAVAAAPANSRKGLLVVAAIAAGVTGLVYFMRRKDDRRRGL